jgi:uncharacterized protein
MRDTKRLLSCNIKILPGKPWRIFILQLWKMVYNIISNNYSNHYLKEVILVKNNNMSALILGDYKKAKYHPLQPVEDILSDILSEHMDLTITEDRDMLLTNNLRQHDLCISYVDSWNEKLGQEYLAGLLAFVAQGKGLLVIHNGISYQSNREFAQLVQGKFINHPPYQELQYRFIREDHPIIAGIENFSMNEELYTFELDNFFDGTILMECSNGEITEPALWVHQYGLGRVVYIAPGHSRESFENDNFKELIRRGALWALNSL